MGFFLLFSVFLQKAVAVHRFAFRHSSALSSSENA